MKKTTKVTSVTPAIAEPTKVVKLTYVCNMTHAHTKNDEQTARVAKNIINHASHTSIWWQLGDVSLAALAVGHCEKHATFIASSSSMEGGVKPKENLQEKSS